MAKPYSSAKIVEVRLFSRPTTSRQKVRRNFTWYDHVEKRMLHGRGGRMDFYYDPQQKRMLPKVVDHEVNTPDTNFADIVKWIKNKQEEYGITIGHVHHGKSIIINVSENMLDEMTADLYRHKIQADY